MIDLRRKIQISEEMLTNGISTHNQLDNFLQISALSSDETNLVRLIKQEYEYSERNYETSPDRQMSTNTLAQFGYDGGSEISCIAMLAESGKILRKVEELNRFRESLGVKRQIKAFKSNHPFEYFKWFYGHWNHDQRINFWIMFSVLITIAILTWKFWGPIVLVMISCIPSAFVLSPTSAIILALGRN